MLECILTNDASRMELLQRCADGINDCFLICATQWMSKIKKKV